LSAIPTGRNMFHLVCSVKLVHNIEIRLFTNGVGNIVVTANSSKVLKNKCYFTYCKSEEEIIFWF